jgi:hypothetical protein
MNTYNNNYTYTNSNIILKYIKLICKKSKKKQKNTHCEFCYKTFTNVYLFNKKNLKVEISDSDIHLLNKHYVINTDLYKKICISDLDIDSFNIEWNLFNTNSINIINGLYEIGSNQIYTEKNKNIKETKISRYSEHSGFIYFDKNKITNINVITLSRVDQADPLIYMPKNCLEALKVNYIFHTHPKTPYIGSRIKNGILYEFPSISDIIHFIDHHNNGKLFASIVIAPEGIYIIRKNNFDLNPIIIDYDILISDLDNIFMECYNDSYLKYSFINYKKHKLDNEIKLPENFFYKQVASNYEYIQKINDVLIKYDLFIEYYARTYYNKPIIAIDKWVIDDIYLPAIKNI